MARKPRRTRDALDGLDLRFTYRTLAVLEAIAAEPGLSNSEISHRAGITDQGQICKLLKRVASKGLVKNLAPHQANVPNVWRLTVKGREVLLLVGSRS